MRSHGSSCFMTWSVRVDDITPDLRTGLNLGHVLHIPYLCASKEKWLVNEYPRSNERSLSWKSHKYTYGRFDELSSTVLGQSLQTG